MEEEGHTQEGQARAEADQAPEIEIEKEIDLTEEIIEIDLVTDKTIILKEIAETIEIIEIQEITVIEDLDLETVEEPPVALVDAEADLEMDQEVDLNGNSCE